MNSLRMNNIRKKTPTALKDLFYSLSDKRLAQYCDIVAYPTDADIAISFSRLIVRRCIRLMLILHIEALAMRKKNVVRELSEHIK